MADTRWRGGATAVAQVGTVQITANDVATRYTLTVGAKTVSVLGQAGGVNATATSLAAAWNASTDPEMEEVTASAATDTVTLTGDTAGVPFTVTSSVSGGTGTIGAVTQVTAATGPYHWDSAHNWTGGAVPATGDKVWVDDPTFPIRYGLAQSGVTLAELHIMASFQDDGGQIGLPLVNASGSTSYAEYRQVALQIGATLCVIGEGDGTGATLVKLDFGAVQATLDIRLTGDSAEDNRAAVQVHGGSNVSNAVNITKGTLDLAPLGGQSVTVATLSVGYATNQTGDSTVFGGPGLALTLLDQQGGTVDLAAGPTTVSKTAGTLVVRSGNVTTWTDDSGESDYDGVGTITTLTLGGSAEFVRVLDKVNCTIANCTMHAGATFTDPHGTCVLSNGIALSRCRLGDVTIDVGVNRTIDVT